MTLPSRQVVNASYIPALRIVAYGIARPQGSKRHVGRGILVESSNVMPWRNTIEHATRAAILSGNWDRPAGPVSVDVNFYFDRPRSHYRTGRHAHELRDNAPRYPATRAQGDLDKLLRAFGDAITSAGAIGDDSQIVYVSARKSYTAPGVASLDRPGMVAILRDIDTPAKGSSQ